MIKNFKAEKKIIKKEIEKTEDIIASEVEFIRKKKLGSLFVQGAFFSFATALLSYILSSYLARFIDEKYVSLVYLLPNIIAVILIFFFGKIIKKFGIFKVALFNMILLMFSLISQIFIKQEAFFVIFTIILYQITSSIFFVFVDYYVEKYSVDGTTGNTKGIQWTLMNLTFLFGPLVAGILLSKLGFDFVFGLSAIMTLPTIFLFVKSFKNIKITHTRTVSINIKKVLKNDSIVRISIVSFLLNLFYCWMAIYVPIYMNKTLGLEWNKIGIIIGIILIPFVIIELPAGKIADKWLGEKELLMTGFIIISISTFLLFFTTNIIVFTLLLFTTRIGASAIEIMREVYLYKKVSTKNIDLISFYKIMSPLAYIVGPILASIILTFSDMKVLFLYLGVILLVTGLSVLWGLKDTKVNFKSKFIEM